MATKAVYIASGIAFAAAVLGFAGYKSMETRNSNDDQQLMETGTGGATASTNPQNVEGGLPDGNSIGDGGMNEGPGNQPNTGSAMNGFQRGGQGGNGSRQAPQSGSTEPNNPGMRRGQGSGGRGNSVSPAEGGNPGAGNSGRTNGGGQGRPPMGEMDFFGTGVMILSDAKVQTELKLTAAQKAAVNQVMKPPQQPQNGDDVGAQVQDYMSRAAEQGQKVKAILDDNQEKRYMQLVHQQMGPIMMLNGSAKDKFGISDDEQKKIGEILNSFSSEFQKSFSGGQMPDMDSIAKVKAQMDTKIIAALDEDSRGKWKLAVGSPFKFSSPMGMGGMMGGMSRGMGGRGGPPGGGGGRRPGGN